MGMTGVCGPVARLMLLVLSCTCAFWSLPARASGDYGCSPGWKLAAAAFTGCDDMAMIGPRNDSRTNLLLLMADLPGATAVAAPSTPSVFLDRASLARAPGDDAGLFSDGEGSRCRSNAQGSADFEAAVRASPGLSERERAVLIAARRALQPDCAQQVAAPAIADVRSGPGRAFAAYLDGAAAFYAGDYDRAARVFAGLAGARDPWLRETARYMVARVAVNRAQLDHYDIYGSPRDDAPIAPALLADAETALRGYMKAYPQGAYFFSARGLLRRVYWLGKDHARLEAEYVALLALPDAQRGIDAVSLAQEIDAKLLSSATADTLRDPLLLAVFDLMQMRGPSFPGDSCCPPITRAALEAQRPRFAGNPALFTYLLSVHAQFVARQPDEVARLIPDASHQANFGYLEFSRQMLRGIALEGRGDQNARGFWADLLPGARKVGQRPLVELALAMHDERDHALARVFAPDSPVRTPEIREILLMHAADARLLRQQARSPAAPAHERSVALFTLLYKEATRGPHGDFVDDLRLVPAGAPAKGGYYDFHTADALPTRLFAEGPTSRDYDCPPLVDTERRLAASRDDPGALLCLGEFVRANDFDGFVLDTALPADELGGTPSLFGAPYSRLDSYRVVMASRAASPDEKAYALFRAINCYAPGGSNTCGGKGVALSVRQGWFVRLKRDYPSSRWAKELRYYW